MKIATFFIFQPFLQNLKFFNNFYEYLHNFVEIIENFHDFVHLSKRFLQNFMKIQVIVITR